MNNKKIIFGILLFCAISFLAYTFANPLEKEDGEGKLVPGSNQVQGSSNLNDKDDDKDNNITGPIKVDDDENGDNQTTDPTQVIPNQSQITQTITPNTTTRPAGTTTNNRPSSGTNNSGSSNTQTPVVPTVPVSDVTISAPANPTLKAGEIINLGASISPSNATNKTITYTSSNTNVAVVDANGKVTAKGAGTATITITASGVTKTFALKVIDNEITTIKAKGLLSNTIVTNNWEGVRNLTISGKVIEDDIYGIRTQIFVPKSYTTDMLKDLRIYLIGEGFTTEEVIKTGINQINNTADIPSGKAYVTYDIYFGEEHLNGDEHLQLAVDWLNTGKPIIYSLDFTEMIIE